MAKTGIMRRHVVGSRTNSSYRDVFTSNSAPESIAQGLREGTMVTTVDGSDGEPMYVYRSGPEVLEPVAVILEQRLEDAEFADCIDMSSTRTH